MLSHAVKPTRRLVIYTMVPTLRINTSFRSNLKFTHIDTSQACIVFLNLPTLNFLLFSFIYHDLRYNQLAHDALKCQAALSKSGLPSPEQTPPKKRAAHSIAPSEPDITLSKQTRGATANRASKQSSVTVCTWYLASHLSATLFLYIYLLDTTSAVPCATTSSI